MMVCGSTADKGQSLVLDSNVQLDHSSEGENLKTCSLRCLEACRTLPKTFSVVRNNVTGEAVQPEHLVI